MLYTLLNAPTNAAHEDKCPRWHSMVLWLSYDEAICTCAHDCHKGKPEKRALMRKERIISNGSAIQQL